MNKIKCAPGKIEGKMTPAEALPNPRAPKPYFPLALSAPSKLTSLRTLKFARKLNSLPSSIRVHSRSFSVPNDDDDDESRVLGDWVVFEEGIFEDPYVEAHSNVGGNSYSDISDPKKHEWKEQVVAENLFPDNWKAIESEIAATEAKARRRIVQEMEFKAREEKKMKALASIRNVNWEEYWAFRETKLAQLKPLVLDNPSSFPPARKENKDGERELKMSSTERVAPKNPRWAVHGKGFDDVNKFFSDGDYELGTKKSEVPRKLFTEEEVMLNRKIPDLAPATSTKWLPLHTLAASGELYLANALLKHNVDVNAADTDGWTALHKAMISKRRAITSFLLRESASPFVRDKDGATLMHYAVQMATFPAIKILLLYNVDINLQDNDGWAPLHLAAQSHRADIVKLLLIKGADRTLKNKDGLTPLDICLHSGRSRMTFVLIKLLKQFPKKQTALRQTPF